jgi:hypothetical protein
MNVAVTGLGEETNDGVIFGLVVGGPDLSICHWNGVAHVRGYRGPKQLK